MKIRIYQINTKRDNNRVAFVDLAHLAQWQGSEEVNSSIYDCVFDGKVPCKNLEDVYAMFNLDHPSGYEGRSLSISDVIQVVESDTIEKGFYFCDTIGFKKSAFNADDAERYRPKTMRVLMVEPGEEAYEKTIGTSLDDIYAAIECECFQAVYPFEDVIAIVCDDEGKLNGSLPNRALCNEVTGDVMDIVFGKFFVCGLVDDDFGSLTDEQMEKYKRLFYQPETITVANGKIVVTKKGESK